MASTAQLLNSVKSGAIWMLLFGLIKKVITFGLNQILIRSASPEIIGAAEIKLELVLATLLFLSRDSIRVACLRVDASKDDMFVRLVNISWIPSLILGVVLITLWISKISLGEGAQSTVVQLYSLAAFIESLGEPWHNAYRSTMYFTASIHADALATFTKSFVTVVCISYLKMGVISYGYAQVLHAIVDLLVLVGYSWVIPIHGSIRPLSAFLPRPMPPTGGTSPWMQRMSAWWDMDTLYLALSTSSTSIMKHLLTQSDKILLSTTVSTHAQGVFAVSSNYASLVARTVFWPMEETCRSAFARLAVDMNSEQREESLATLKRLLLFNLALVSMLGYCFMVFGVPLVPLFVRWVMGGRWFAAETIWCLQSFCYYIVVLGLNGITEAFVFAVASPKEFQTTFNLNLLLSSLVFVGTTMVVQRLWPWLGTTSVVIGNIGSMCIRIVYSAIFIHRWIVVHSESPAMSSSPWISLWTAMQWVNSLSHQSAVWIMLLVTAGNAVALRMAYQRWVGEVGDDITLHSALWLLLVAATAFAITSSTGFLLGRRSKTLKWIFAPTETSKKTL